MKIGLGLSLSSVQRRRTDPFAALISTLNADAAQLIIHPLEYGSMFQDRAGTTPVTESGQLVGHVLDAGGGDFHATAVSDAARGIFRDVGGFRYIEYNGVNTAYQTPVLPAPGVDKAQVFAGVRKLSDAAVGVVSEFSPSATSNNGSIAIFAPGATSGVDANRLTGAVRDAGTRFYRPTDEFAAPVTAVATLLADIAADRSFRLNGAIVDAETRLGTGNFNPAGSYPLFIGARNGTSLFFNGRHYATLGPITRFGANATAAQIEAAEAYYTARTDL